MHKFLILAVLGVLLLSLSCSRTPDRISRPAIDAAGIAYYDYFDQHPELLLDPDAVDLAPVLAIGKRNLQWIIAINSTRTIDSRISLSSAERSQAFPIDSPRIYNKEIVLRQYDELVKTMPPAMLQILTSSQTLPTAPALNEADHIEWGWKTDIIYQLAARWLSYKPELEDAARERKNDVRGLYYLKRIPNLEHVLRSWDQLALQDQTTYREWLIGVCMNTKPLIACAGDFDRLVAMHGDVAAYWDRYKEMSQNRWDQFFQIQHERKDIHWDATDASTATIPVIDPQNPAIAAYLKDNVEDEWTWNGWHLKLNYLASGDPLRTAHILFKAGATPNVDSWNRITMDENSPLTEYTVIWAIRHEFGHVLGFPDCYVEFYDKDRGIMVNYQLDVTDLMCSRQGKLKQNHFDEMKRVYFH